VLNKAIKGREKLFFKRVIGFATFKKR